MWSFSSQDVGYVQEAALCGLSVAHTIVLALWGFDSPRPSYLNALSCCKCFQTHHYSKQELICAPAVILFLYLHIAVYLILCQKGH